MATPSGAPAHVGALKKVRWWRLGHNNPAAKPQTLLEQLSISVMSVRVYQIR